MTLVLKHGVTDGLVDMVYSRLLDHRYYVELVKKLGESGVRKQLDSQEWLVGFYEEGECIAALYGNSEINLVTKKGYENRWITPSVFRRFWSWFFSKYDKAIAEPDNGLVIPFMLRIGFHWEDGKLACSKTDLRVPV